MDDVYRNPGPLQFDGPGADTKAVSLCVEDQDYMGRIKQLQEYLEKVKEGLVVNILYHSGNIKYLREKLLIYLLLQNFIFFVLIYIFFQVRTIVKPGCSQDVLKAALSAMSSVTEILSVLSSSGNAPF